MAINTVYTPRLSKYGCGLFAFLYSGACICVVIITLSILVKLLLFLFVVYLFILLTGVRQKKSITKFCLDGNNRNWCLWMESGDENRARLEENSIVTRFFILLNFRCLRTNEKYSIYLFSDGMPSKQLRRLRFDVFYCHSSS